MLKVPGGFRVSKEVSQRRLSWYFKRFLEVGIASQQPDTLHIVRGSELEVMHDFR